MKHRGCIELKDNGQLCHAPKLQEGDYCLMHSPEHAQEMAEARRLGGLRRRREVAVSGAFEFAGLGSVTDIRRLLEVAVIDTLGLENSISRNRTLAYLATTAIKLLEVGELEARIEALEGAVHGTKPPQKPVFDEDTEDVGFSIEAE